MAGTVVVAALAAMLMADFDFARSGSAATNVFVAAQDTRVVELYPTNKYGTAPTLNAKVGSGTRQESYLRFRVSGVTGTVTSSTVQMGFPQAELAAGTKNVVAYFHHARFSDGPHSTSVGCATKFFALLYQAEAGLVLSGHNHIYERLTDINVQGTPVADGLDQFVVGQGVTTTTPSPWSMRASPRRPRAPWTSGATPVRAY